MRESGISIPPTTQYEFHIWKLYSILYEIRLANGIALKTNVEFEFEIKQWREMEEWIALYIDIRKHYWWQIHTKKEERKTKNGIEWKEMNIRKQKNTKYTQYLLQNRTKQ